MMMMMMMMMMLGDGWGLGRKWGSTHVCGSVDFGRERRGARPRFFF